MLSPSPSLAPSLTRKALGKTKSAVTRETETSPSLSPSLRRKVRTTHTVYTPTMSLWNYRACVPIKYNLYISHGAAVLWQLIVNLQLYLNFSLNNDCFRPVVLSFCCVVLPFHVFPTTSWSEYISLPIPSRDLWVVHFQMHQRNGQQTESESKCIHAYFLDLNVQVSIYVIFVQANI